MDLTVPHSICSTISSDLATLLSIAETYTDTSLQDLAGVSYLLNAIALLPSSIPKASKKKATPKRKAARNDGRRKGVHMHMEVEDAVEDMHMEVEEDLVEEDSSSDDVLLSQLYPPLQHPPPHDTNLPRV